jgi:hypothetical protein
MTNQGVGKVICSDGRGDERPVMAGNVGGHRNLALAHFPRCDLARRVPWRHDHQVSERALRAILKLSPF